MKKNISNGITGLANMFFTQEYNPPMPPMPVTLIYGPIHVDTPYCVIPMAVLCANFKVSKFQSLFVKLLVKWIYQPSTCKYHIQQEYQIGRLKHFICPAQEEVLFTSLQTNVLDAKRDKYSV